MGDDDSKKTILARRARFVAAALAGMNLAMCGGKSDSNPAPCLSVARDRDAATPQPCLSKIPDDAGPQVCLSPLPPDAGDPDAGDADPDSGDGG